jgi:hypothetical protein
MAEEKYYAVYEKGNQIPIGTLRDSNLEALAEIKKATGKDLRTEPVDESTYWAIRNRHKK